jgi:predicted O-methyltransferase YrrM
VDKDLTQRWAALRRLVGGLGASQRPEEFAAAWRRVRCLRPSVFCEIGSAGGGSLFLYAAACAPDATLLAIDNSREKVHRTRLALVMDHLWREGYRAELIRGDSRSRATRDVVSDSLRGRPFDFLHIDGSHIYDACRSDWDNYAWRVRPGGLVALHDIVFSDDEAHQGGSGRLLRELEAEGYGVERCIQTERLPRDVPVTGIGLVRIPESVA